VAPNHQYVTVAPTECVRPASPNSGPVTVEVISVRSDEPEDARGGGDGSTDDDIIIQCPYTVQLRAEREGGSDGRVYTITYAVTDLTGTKRVDCKVYVPHDQSGRPAVEGPGPGYEVTGSCNGGGILVGPVTRQPSRETC